MAILRAVEDLSFGGRAGDLSAFWPQRGGQDDEPEDDAGIIRPSAGEIEVLGSDSAMGVRERVGYLPEERGLIAG